MLKGLTFFLCRTYEFERKFPFEITELSLVLRGLSYTSWLHHSSCAESANFGKLIWSRNHTYGIFSERLWEKWFYEH